MVITKSNSKETNYYKFAIRSQFEYVRYLNTFTLFINLLPEG